MSEKLPTAEDAQVLLDAAAAAEGIAPLTLSSGTLINLSQVDADAYNAMATLFSEAPRLARALIAMTEERDKWRTMVQGMVKKAADKSLDGYRELGATCARLERQRDDEAKMRREFIDAVHAECDAPEWEYPGQVIRDVGLLRKQRDNARADVDRLRDALVSQDRVITEQAEWLENRSKS